MPGALAERAESLDAPARWVSVRLRRTLLLVAVGLASVTAAANVVVLGRGRGEPLATAEPADCALVLGAGVSADGTPSDVLRDRLDETLALWRSGRVRKILVSGDHRTVTYDETNAMRRYLEAHDVPAEAIFMDHAGLDTYSSVWRAKNVFGAARVIVVTQQFHLSRALWMARALGLEADGVAADRRLYRGAVWLHAREVGSRTKAVVDVLTKREPRHGRAHPVNLSDDGRVTAG